MPCSSQGFPPSPADFTELGRAIQSIESAQQYMRELEKKLEKCRGKNKKLKKKIKQLKAAIKIVGNGG